MSSQEKIHTEKVYIYAVCPIYEVKCLFSCGWEWKREESHAHLHFNIWFLWCEDIVIWIWVWYLYCLQNAKTLKFKCLFFSHFMIWNWKPLISKSWHSAASEDIMTKSKSQGLHIIRIKYWNTSGSVFPPSLIPTLWNIGILLHKQATLGKHFWLECMSLFFRQVCLFKSTGIPWFPRFPFLEFSINRGL